MPGPFDSRFERKCSQGAGILFKFVESQGAELSFSERIAPAKGPSHGGKITLLSGTQPPEEFSTLVHEIAHLCGAEIYVALASGCA
jgi:hypothetical protein